MNDSTRNPAGPNFPFDRDQITEPGRSFNRRSAGGAVADPSHVVIGAGAKLKGEISGCSQLEIRGYADGEFSAESVVVHEGGELHGQIRVEEATVCGILDGTISVANKLDVRENGAVSGDLTYCNLSVETGGSLTGNIKVKQTAEDVAEAKPTPRTKSNGADTVAPTTPKTIN